MIDEKELIKLSPKELIDLGICPTCLNRKYNGTIYGDDKNTLLFKDESVEIFFSSNPRSKGHLIISSINHYKDMSEAPDELNKLIVIWTKFLMNEIKRIYEAESVYLCTMCDGPMNHYHVQLIPRYKNEERGSKNFVKPRMTYVFEEDKFKALQCTIKEYALKINNELN